MNGDNRMITHNTNWERLRTFCQKVIMEEGVSADNAVVVADNLVDADLCGVESHGVSRMPIYMKRLEDGVVSKELKMTVEQEYPASIAFNACNSMGMLAGMHAMRRCIEKAKLSGCCFATVNNSNHYGMAAYYLYMPAAENMVGFTATNTPPNIAPWGSSESYLGTNPIGVSVPRRDAWPIVLDMAPSVVAMGKVILAAKLGQSIPEGWAITRDGRSTTNAKEGMEGTVLPIGGPKGYGLSLFVDILAGILSGAQFGPHINNMWNDFENPQNVGHIFCAIDIAKFVDVDIFKNRIEQLVNEIKSLKKTPGVEEIFMPGEIEQKRRADRKVNGLPLSGVVYDELKMLGEKYNVEFNI